eukprot:TRINITY_DN2370_c0_g1_i1.p1 TRINITY_DN2370_c0_g1~~TRINITY_DN2370_c0_g1_i1.p1  ORF type:complete len:587 (-),score=72.97 TRINITY_DN2370_c0_g1_i1:61-1821(-)
MLDVFRTLLLNVIVPGAVSYLVYRVAGKTKTFDKTVPSHMGNNQRNGGEPEAGTGAGTPRTATRAEVVAEQQPLDFYEEVQLEERPILRQHGFSYEGQWVFSTRHGKGVLKREGIGSFLGQFRNGYPDGEGVLTMPKPNAEDMKPSEFKGQWLDGNADGEGTFCHADGYTYIGEWSFDFKHGTGEESFGTSSYQGTFVHGYRHGQGKIKFPDGTTYEGEMFRDDMHGAGRYVFHDEAVYVGNWLHGKMHGAGTVLWRDGSRLEACFNGSTPEGEFTFAWPVTDGRSIKSQFNSDGLVHGNGFIIEDLHITPREWRTGRPVEYLQLGDLVVVVTSFTTSQNVECKRGVEGSVTRIHEGDVFVTFRGHSEEEMIDRENSHNMSVITRPKQEWRIGWTHKLCERGEENVFEARIRLLDKTTFTSVGSAIEHLNGAEGTHTCPEGVCVVFSKSTDAYFLLWRGDAWSKAEQLCGIDLEIGSSHEHVSSPPRSALALTLRKGRIVRIFDESFPHLFDVEAILQEFHEEDRTWLVMPRGSNTSISVMEDSLVQSELVPKVHQPSQLDESPKCQPGLAYKIKLLGPQLGSVGF